MQKSPVALTPMRTWPSVSFGGGTSDEYVRFPLSQSTPFILRAVVLQHDEYEWVKYWQVMR